MEVKSRYGLSTTYVFCGSWLKAVLATFVNKSSSTLLTNSVRKAITAHSDGLFVENGEVVDELSDEDQKMWDQYKKYEYYFMNQKIKE